MTADDSSGGEIVGIWALGSCAGKSFLLVLPVLGWDSTVQKAQWKEAEAEVQRRGA